jgi:predicted nucleic acid-binding protein
VKSAYVDSSCLVAIALNEPGSQALLVRISRYDRLFSTNLLEAELRSALSREGNRSGFGNFLALMRWVFPHRRLTPEIDRILEAGLLRGPDLWHLACALFLRPRVDELSFLTLDNRQGEIARSLGLRGL